jgi:hypothetical protein
MRGEQFDEGVGDLLAHALLNSEPPGVQPDEAGQLGDPDDLLVRDVRDVRDPVERQRRVLTQRVERDRPVDDLAEPAVGPAVALGRKGGDQSWVPS